MSKGVCLKADDVGFSEPVLLSPDNDIFDEHANIV